MTVNIVNNITSNVNEKQSACAYSQLKRWDAQPVMEYHLYMYKITEKESKSLEVHKLRQLKKDRHAAINKALMDNAVELKIKQRYFVSNEAHIPNRYS